MAPSLVEVNFRRLLGKCESMVAKAQQSDGKFEWRIEKYLEALRFQLQDIGKQSSKPDQEVLREYKRKVDFLQGVIQTEKIQCSSSKLRAYQQLIPASSNLHSDHCSNSQHVSDLSKDIHLLSRGRYHKEMRNELFGLEDENLDGGLKRRRGVSTEDHSTKEDIDEIIRQHHEKQEKVAEEMIKMAQNMKHTSLAASNIIKADKDTLEASTKVVEKNVQKLKKESNRLEEMNSRKCSWWLWVMLIIVCIVFLLMILFIKFFPARSR